MNYIQFLKQIIINSTKAIFCLFSIYEKSVNYNYSLKMKMLNIVLIKCVLKLVLSLSHISVFSVPVYIYSLESEFSASWISVFQCFFCLGLQPYPFILVE